MAVSLIIQSESNTVRVLGNHNPLLLLLGMTTSITIFVICLWSKQAIVNSPVMNFEVSQNGTAGMYIKYQMAAFLLIFAITMQIQFVSYLFEAVADLRNEPDKRKIKPISH